MRFYLVIIFIFSFKIIFSQIDSSKAVIYIKQKDAIIYLDGKKIQSKKELRKISVGTHYIKAWAPKRMLLEDSFIVKSKINKFYSKSLKYTDDYKAYVFNKRVRFLTYAIPAFLSVGFGVTYYKKYLDFDKKILKTQNEAYELEAKYNDSFAPEEFQTNYAAYYQKVKDYNDLQNNQKKSKIIGITVSSVLAATAITVFVIQKVKKKVPFTETPLLSRVTPGYNPFNKQICLTVKLY